MMKLVFIFTISLLVFHKFCWCKDLMVGTSYNAHLAYQHKAEYVALPFIKRTKDVFYSDGAQHIIKGIIARDLDQTDSSAIITAGGVGSPFVNIRLKSARGGSLNYNVEIYG